MSEQNSGNVRLIDPHSANHQHDLVNEIHNYEDMFIFAELIASRRGRSVIIKSDRGMKISDEGSDDEISVNLMGVNQNKKSSDFGNFTTNYYDGSTGGNDVYESFGITKIHVKTNSSYIPQVEIQFTDVRGLSFFNQKNSKYRILFDFPPPIFTLTLKGYYGKTLTYKLHLVNYKTEFNSNNGNYVINGSFIALTFAPLTDVLFRYVVNIGMLDDGMDELNSDPNRPPSNTFELIMKLKNLYSAVNERVKGSNENKEYQNVIDSINKIDKLINLLDNYNNDSYLNKYKPYMVILQSSDNNNDLNNDSLIKVNKSGDYLKLVNKYSVSGKIPSNIPDRLLIVFQEYTDTLFDNTDSLFNENTKTSEIYIKTLNSYRDKLISIGQNELNRNIVNDDSIDRATKPIINKYNVSNGKELDKNIKYHNIDLSNYYIRLVKEKNRLREKKDELGGEISGLINDMVIDNLGMKPTIQNIFSIILDDVDKFFRILRKTAIEAEGDNGHTDNYNAFVNNNSPDIKVMNNNDSNKNKIYAFPLFIKEQKLPCNGFTEVRSAPIETFGSYELPEITLIHKFIETFTRQGELVKLSRMREERNSDGSKIWIPISPFDSTYNLGLEENTPYTDFNDDLLNSDMMSKIFTTLVNRFNVISQNILRYKYSNYQTDKSVNEAYVKLYAESEMLNILLSTTNKNVLNLLETNIKTYKSDIELFYRYLDKINILNTISNSKHISLGKSNDSKMFIDKSGDNFKGVFINNDTIQLNTETSTSSPLNEFNDNAKENFLKRVVNELTGNQNIDAKYKFSNDNLIYIPDVGLNTSSNEIFNIPIKYDNLSLFSRYIFPKYNTYLAPLTKKIGLNRIDDDSDLISGGNKGIELKTNVENFFNPLTSNASNSEIIKTTGSVYENWKNVFNNDDLFNKLFNLFNEDGLTDLKLLMLVSNFGSTLGPFNNYPLKLNELFFTIPSIVEVPNFFIYYIGTILSISENSDDYSKFIEYFGEDDIRFLILADFSDFNTYISTGDKNMFKLRYENFKNTEESRKIITRFKELLDDINNNDDDDRGDYFLELSNPNGSDGIYFNEIIKPLMNRVNLVVNTQLTFSMLDITPPSNYISLSDYRNDFNETTDDFFTHFFKSFLDEVSKKNNELDEREKELNKIKEDEDIITQTYYSFKNINDKWLTGTENGINGYPNIPSSNELKDHFIFVDRAMNPIGDTIIDAEILVDLFDDHNVNVFTVLSQILSINGFEFFPLQNFMSYKGDDWKESFKITTNTKISTNNFFVCMYIGGASSQPFSSNGFHDDGIVDISNPGVPDFSTTDDCDETETDGQIINDRFPYREVRAFKVRFGEQNQSMFTDYKINSKDHPETNESINILSRLAGDNNKQAPIPKGQNLYNLYENRSYSATIIGLGNMMIQPTQYFQLENIPLYNGAYVVLSVEHEIVPNKMTTSFSGTKILKYPIPRVLSPVAFTEFKDFNDISSGDIVKQATVIENIDDVRYNSMYESKIINVE